MCFILAGSPLGALRETARLRRKEGCRPGSRKNLISCQTLFIQFALVYEVDLQALVLDDFGAKFLLISGRSPAIVKYYLSAVKVLFFLGMACRRHGQRTLLPCLEPHPQSHLLLSGSLAGPQIGCHQRRLPQTGGCLPGSPQSGAGVRIPGLPPRTPPTAKSFDPARHSSWADVKPGKEGLLLDLKWTKTLQTQRGITTFPMAALQDKQICAVSTWELYRHMLPWVTPTAPPHSCSRQLHQSGKSSQPPPSGPSMFHILF